jgi:hypothetical protein
VDWYQRLVDGIAGSRLFVAVYGYFRRICAANGIACDRPSRSRRLHSAAVSHFADTAAAVSNDPIPGTKRPPNVLDSIIFTVIYGEPDETSA